MSSTIELVLSLAKYQAILNTSTQRKYGLWFAGSSDSSNTKVSLEYWTSFSTPTLLWASQVVSSVAEAHSCTVKIGWREPHYPPTVNDAATTLDVEKLAKKLVGEDKWTTLQAPSMGGEDFSFLASEHSS